MHFRITADYRDPDGVGLVIFDDGEVVIGEANIQAGGNAYLRFAAESEVHWFTDVEPARCDPFALLLDAMEPTGLIH